jgi:hypothetical protein
VTATGIVFTSAASLPTNPSTMAIAPAVIRTGTE